MTLHAAFGNADHIDDHLELARLLGAALGGGQTQPQAFLAALRQILGGHRTIHRQPHPQRVLGFVGSRVILAQVLVDHPQIESEIVGARAAGQQAVGQQYPVVGLTLGEQFGFLGGDTAAPGLPVQNRQLRPGDILNEDAAQALGVFGGGGHRHAALTKARASPGITGTWHDRPALEILLHPLHGRFAQSRATVGV